MEALHLIVGIAGQRVALAARHVESVVEIDSVTPVPLVVPHIAGLAALRSRVLTIVDTLAALDLGRMDLDDVMQAVIVTIDGHLYGLLVEEVEDVISLADAPSPVCAVLEPGWSRVASGMVEIDGDALLLIDLAALVAGPGAMAA
ncbi:MAG: chemotaxis protein CheW [Sphingomonas sp.]|nr:chemotaxis protein CheW [Sphingomonas sp.]MDX3883367.1 chemotaxis protein CheW [Sphingomonas sp.]